MTKITDQCINAKVKTTDDNVHSGSRVLRQSSEFGGWLVGV